MGTEWALPARRMKLRRCKVQGFYMAQSNPEDAPPYRMQALNRLMIQSNGALQRSVRAVAAPA